MLSTHPTIVAQEDVFQLAQVVFDAMLQMPMERIDTPPKEADTDSVSAMVRVTGAWQGEITLLCSRGLAARAAAIMFAMPEAEVGISETLDAMGELANMIGGNVKALIPGPSTLSLPCLGAEAEKSATADAHAARVTFISADGLCGSASVRESTH